MSDANDLLAVLDLEQIEFNIFRGFVPQNGRRRVFGGLVVAQALVATSRTVATGAPHSLHAYFILPGDPSMPIVYEVERVRDGRSFTTRRCIAVQAGRTIFDLFASFQVEERGLDHQVAMPAAPDPAGLLSARAALAPDNPLPERMQLWAGFEPSIEIRPCDPHRYDPAQPAQAHQQVWIRVAAPLPDDPAIHRAALAYLSDLTLIDVALAAHGRTLFEPEFAVASLDHALWFHRAFRADEWLLYTQDSPTTSGSRGLARGLIFDQAGRLVASVVQEGLIRMRPG